VTGGAAAANALEERGFHWPGLDGLRGIAVVAVMLFHAYSFTPNGYVGVDVFFGLSGFLITTLLLREHESTGRIHLPDFYMRRVLRLYPALVAAVLLVLVASLVGQALPETWPGMVAALFYVAHLWIYTGHEAPLLEHTWTLSLEEHFYLVWPALLGGFLSVRWTRVAAGVSLLALAALLVVRGLLPEGVQAAYQRATPMVYGCVASLWWMRSGRLRRAPAWLGAVTTSALLVLVGLTFWPTPLPAMLMMGWSSLPGVLSVIVLLGLVAVPIQMSVAQRALRVTALRWVGKRAYGLYLYHFPVLSLLVHQVPVGPNWARATTGLMVTIGLAAVSYRWLETPFLRLKSRFRHEVEDRRTTGATRSGGPPDGTRTSENGGLLP
jgi:peptidoglycan/LPS O-acetylase OafA/YrhL